MSWISCSGRAIGFAVFCVGFLGSTLVLSSSFALAQESTPKSSPVKTAHKQTQGSRRKLLDSDKVIFDAIAAIDRYEAAAEKPVTEESPQIQKRAIAAVSKITDLGLLSYIQMLFDWGTLIRADQTLFWLGKGKNKNEFKKHIMQYHQLRDGLVEEIKANLCCYPPPGFDPAK